MTHGFDDFGGFSLRARLDADQGALFEKALEATYRALLDDAKDDDPKTDPDGRPTRPDALVAPAEGALESGVTSGSGGDRFQVMVTVDADALRERPDDGCATLDGGVPLGLDAARRLACDCHVVGLATTNGHPLSLGRKRRTPSRSLRRALGARDHGCRFPGCRRRGFIDAHHIQHWIDDGLTDPDNLVLLCRRHHRLVHEGGYGVAVVGDAFVFTDPTGRVLEQSPSLHAPGPAIEAVTAAAGVQVDHATLAIGWNDPANYDDAVSCLSWENHPPRDPPAP